MPPQSPVDRQQIENALKRLDRLSTWLDSRYRIPGIGVRFGWDSLLGLIPVAGDIAGSLLSLYFIYEAWRIKAPSQLLIKMGGNVAVELAGGAIPILGDLFDVYWKSNRRNVVLLREHLEALLPPEHPPMPKRFRLSGWLLRLLVGLLVITGALFSVYALRLYGGL